MSIGATVGFILLVVGSAIVAVAEFIQIRQHYWR